MSWQENLFTGGRGRLILKVSILRKLQIMYNEEDTCPICISETDKINVSLTSGQYDFMIQKAVQQFL